MGSIGNETVVNLRMLLSELVDQEKSVFEFDDNLGIVSAKRCAVASFFWMPAYKSGELVILATLSHVIGFLKYFMHERIVKVLSDFSQHRMGSGIVPDKPALTTFDADFVSY
jgi:hypothetical protein